MFGAVIDEDLKDEIRVTLIATGFEGSINRKVSEILKEEILTTKTDVPKTINDDKKEESQEERKDFKKNNSNDKDDDYGIPAFLRKRDFNK